MRPAVVVLFRTLAVLLLPALAVGAAYAAMEASALGLPAGGVLLHGLTLAWVLLFYRRRYGRVSVLPLSFLASLAGPYLYETWSPGWFQYLGTWVFALFYALPWAAITLVVGVVILVREKKKKGAM